MQEKRNKNSEISARVMQLIESLGITANHLAKILGYKRAQTIYDIVNGKSAPSFDFFNKLAMSEYSDKINIDWLLTGRGEIFNTKSTENVVKENDHNFDHDFDHKRKVQKTWSNSEVEKVVVDNVFKLRTDRLVERQQIPIYDMEAVAGLVPLFAEHYSQSVVEVMETTLIPKCDGGLRIVGDSMYPLLKSGDIVFYKQIHDILNNIVWGEMYLISFDIDGEEYVSVKYLQKSELKDHITLVSYNEHHKPLDIHIGRIRALAFIKASLRLNSIK